MHQKIVFLCGARDYHAYDWYDLARKNIRNKQVVLLTDLIAGEGFKSLISQDDALFKLFVIDALLFKRPNRLGDYWRNMVKIIVLPIQLILLKRFAKSHPHSDFHAHGMYYMLLAALAGLSFVGTPQGSEILVRPFRSRIYRICAIWTLRKARAITVDSKQMCTKVKSLSNVDSRIIQNGIDTSFLGQMASKVKGRNYFLSIRGFTPLYRIDYIIKSCNKFAGDIPLYLIYPFADNSYKLTSMSLLKPVDMDLGRLERFDMYRVMSGARLVISIPSSDSSPRSVYEAIFCGCLVVVAENEFLDILPLCMRERIFVVNPELNKNWLYDAINWSRQIDIGTYRPSREALDLFDQNKSILLMNEQVYL